MEFEWDENKRQQNLEKHRVDFIVLASRIFDGRPTFTYQSPRNDEERWATVGIVNERFFVVVWTKRGERTRIIAAYRADDWEIREYQNLYGGTA